MKQLKLFLVLLIIGAIATSCEKEESVVNNVKLVTKIIETDPDGLKKTRLYEYDGAKLKGVTETSSEGTTIYTYKYTGDNITKITESNARGIYKTMSFIYAGDKLSMWAENYETDSEFDFFAENVTVMEYAEEGGEIHLAKKYRGNALQETTRFYESGGMYIKHNLTTGLFNTYIFDTKSNPHKNIIGWAKLEKINHMLYSNFNVTQVEHIVDEDLRNEDFVFNYNYDSSGFPTSMTRENIYKDIDSRKQTTQYFYNQ